MRSTDYAASIVKAIDEVLSSVYERDYVPVAVQESASRSHASRSGRPHRRP